ncbi:MFS transporter [Ancylobacter defluvii]|uniref:MFS transporter n=1 Tax=Ancylobacter defluvii TaxID=1282440 RepID=A0A9W6N9N4_9HYPH|nr:MFS transporter [Ancylobacter defluvii]MBS7590067.1 MFS transporter [Ancylobacter defluvii]GLK82677.1 MFS transporter [Ancylobacter defluvii]
MTFATPETPAIHWRQRAARALRNPLYRRYFLAQMPLVVGSWIHSIAIGWLMWRLSASPWLLGLLALCELGPTFLLGPIAGTVSDRLDRRRLLICTQAAFITLVSLLGFLTLTDRVTVETVMLLTLSIGIVTAFDSPTRQAFVAELVGLDDLRNAIALNSMLFNAARLIGPAVGGAIVASFGEGWCFALKALAYVPMLVMLVRLKGVAPIRRVREPFFTEMRRGFAFIRSRPTQARILVLVGICSFTSVPYFSFLPALANTMLNSDATVAGMLMSLTGIGAVIAAVLLTVFDRLSILRLYPGWSALLLGLTQIGIGLSTSLAVTAALALPMGFAILSQNLASNSLLQQFTPPAFRGRVMAMYAMMMLGTVPFGSLIVGGLGDRLGMPFTFIAGGIVCAVAALVILLLPEPPTEPHSTSQIV